MGWTNHRPVPTVYRVTENNDLHHDPQALYAAHSQDTHSLDLGNLGRHNTMTSSAVANLELAEHSEVLFPSPPILPFPYSSLPFLPSLPLLSPPLPYPSLSSFLSSLPLEVGLLNPARGSGECGKLPKRGLRRIPSRHRIWCILALKYDIQWQHFQRFSWESTSQILCSLNSIKANFFASLHDETLL